MDSTAIFDAVRSVTGAWARQRKAEEREAARISRRRDALVRSRRMTVREAAWHVLPQAYLKASSNGSLPAHARQIMYAARGEIQRLAGRMLDDQYFTQQLLPDFMNEHPAATAEWDVVFDARGHFHEPHTGRIVPLGTIEVRRHLCEVAQHTLPELQVGLPEMAIFPTCGPGHRYGAILFVEKEGFLPLFRAVRLAERYDLAIMSTKGLSVTASRLLVDRLCAAHQVPLLVLHDFDKSGFSILGTLRRDTRRYAFRNRIEVVDLGLRLADVEDSGLEAEDVFYSSDPAPNLRKNGATAEEIAFLRSRRVELNAFASADFVTWIEGKLEQHGVAKIVPDRDTLTLAYRRAVAARYVTSRLESAVHDAQRHAADASVPDDLVALVASRLRNDSAQSWDDVIQRIAMQRAGANQGERVMGGDTMARRLGPLQLEEIREVDPDGQIVVAHRTVDTLRRLLRSGGVTEGMHDAGRAFQRDFQFAALDPIRARPIVLPAGGRGRSEMTECRLHARHRVHRALERLGGIGSPGGSCIWHVVGCGCSVREWAIRQGWNGRPVRQEQAMGILVAALGVLAKEFDG